jgi:hypothetical protein
MLLAALVVGGLATYYLGVRAGVIAAGASAVLFIVADVVPALAVWVYAIVGVGVLALCAVGPRVQQQSHRQRVSALGRELAGRIYRLMRR